MLLFVAVAWALAGLARAAEPVDTSAQGPPSADEAASGDAASGDPSSAKASSAKASSAEASSAEAPSGDASFSWSPLTPCPHCDLLVGIGTTYKFWSWTDGLVVPLTLELDDSRWELGAFRFTTGQYLKEPTLLPLSTFAANPSWGFTAMRRWQVLRRDWGRLYLGFGANYRTETDFLESTYWNFAYLLGARFPFGRSRAFLELDVRHWSNAWFRLPNRGENLVTVSFSY